MSPLCQPHCLPVPPSALADPLMNWPTRWHRVEVIVWVNGAFGVGKTTTSTLVVEKDRRLRLFDPESVGFMLRENLSDYPVCDFRDWESWRILTPLIADELVRFSGQHLVAPQTVLEEVYWDELVTGLSARGHDVFHVVLDAAESVIRERVRGDTALVLAKEGRLGHLPRYLEARNWLLRRADLVVDTTHLNPQQAADGVWDVAAEHLGTQTRTP
jgi:hypothetical protein